MEGREPVDHLAPRPEGGPVGRDDRGAAPERLRLADAVHPDELDEQRLVERGHLQRHHRGERRVGLGHLEADAAVAHVEQGRRRRPHHDGRPVLGALAHPAPPVHQPRERPGDQRHEAPPVHGHVERGRRVAPRLLARVLVVDRREGNRLHAREQQPALANQVQPVVRPDARVGDEQVEALVREQLAPRLVGGGPSALEPGVPQEVQQAEQHVQIGFHDQDRVRRSHDAISRKARRMTGAQETQVRYRRETARRTHIFVSHGLQAVADR